MEVDDDQIKEESHKACKDVREKMRRKGCVEKGKDQENNFPSSRVTAERA